uniref:Elongation of very long chain fatty acids protein n=1 Tax=Culex pipiens TaxID=7175 RepID=A0A8D8BDW6_CULPI
MEEICKLSCRMWQSPGLGRIKLLAGRGGVKSSKNRFLSNVEIAIPHWLERRKTQSDTPSLTFSFRWSFLIARPSSTQKKTGGHSSFFGLLNTFVHIIMYAYYMLAAMGPKVQKYLWWKKYLTVLQMIQFVLVMAHAFQLLFWNECNFPSAFAYFIGAHALMFYFLFSNFYKRAYAERKQPKEKVEKQQLVANGNLESEPNKNIEQHSSPMSAHYQSNGKSSFYQAVGKTVEESYSSTRHRVYVGAVNN